MTSLSDINISLSCPYAVVPNRLRHSSSILVTSHLTQSAASWPRMAADIVVTLLGMGFPFHARKRFPGVELVADDADVRVGSGAQVSAAMSDILLALAGRKAGLDGLSGPVPSAARR